VKRRIAATAATAALAVASPAAAATPQTARGKSSVKPRVSRVAGAERGNAAQAIEAMRRAERDSHRRHLAAALAAELPGGATAVEHGLRDGEAGEIGASLAAATGASEEQVEQAFEQMARHALERRLLDGRE
jgi:hypothetical protein